MSSSVFVDRYQPENLRAKTDWIKTDTIGKAMNNSIARPVGRKNQKNVLCRMVMIR